MTKRTRRTYSDEFKQDAVNMLNEPGATLAQVSRDLGVHVSLLTKWKRKLKEVRQEATSEPELTEDERLELARLRSEVKRLRIEREILKKATAFFVNEKP